MPSYRYVGPYDSADIPLLHRSVLQAEVFDVPDELAHLFDEQPANFEPTTDAPAVPVADPAQEG